MQRVEQCKKTILRDSRSLPNCVAHIVDMVVWSRECITCLSYCWPVAGRMLRIQSASSETLNDFFVKISFDSIKYEFV